MKSEVRKKSEKGFTLMEVALAVVVVGVGIMAVFSLIASGLDSSRKAIEETQASIFANNVFNGLRAAALTNAEISAVQWANFWSSGTIPVAAYKMWNGSPMTITWTPNQPLATPIALSFINTYSWDQSIPGARVLVCLCRPLSIILCAITLLLIPPRLPVRPLPWSKQLFMCGLVELSRRPQIRRTRSCSTPNTTIQAIFDE